MAYWNPGAMAKEITFESVCEIEPQVADLLASAQENKLQVDKTYLWENFLKLQISQLVGPNSKHPGLRSDAARRVVVQRIAGALGLLLDPS